MPTEYGPARLYRCEACRAACLPAQHVEQQMFMARQAATAAETRTNRRLIGLRRKDTHRRHGKKRVRIAQHENRMLRVPESNDESSQSDN
jgi:hypothetical protein